MNVILMPDEWFFSLRYFLSINFLFIYKINTNIINGDIMQFVIGVTIKTEGKNDDKSMYKKVSWHVRPVIRDNIVIDGIDSKVKSCSINFDEKSFTVDIGEHEVPTTDDHLALVNKLRNKGWES